jgi:hypothetical protein
MSNVRTSKETFLKSQRIVFSSLRHGNMSQKTAKYSLRSASTKILKRDQPLKN